jgi:hypothetical protein
MNAGAAVCDKLPDSYESIPLFDEVTTSFTLCYYRKHSLLIHTLTISLTRYNG